MSSVESVVTHEEEDEDELERKMFEGRMKRGTNQENVNSENNYDVKSAVRLSSWVRSRNQNDVEIEGAIRRWQLHKGSIAPSALDSNGNFDQYDPDESQQVQYVTKDQHRVLANSFLKLFRYYRKSKASSEATERLVQNQRLSFFRRWHKAYVATRLDRLKSLFKFFTMWLDFTKITVKVNGDLGLATAFHSLYRKQKGLHKLLGHVVNKCEKIVSLDTAITHRHFVTYRRIFRVWKQKKSLWVMKRVAFNTAKMHFAVTKYSSAIRILRTYARLSRSSQCIIAANETLRKKSVIRRWISALEIEKQENIRFQGACLLYDIQLEKKAFLNWKRRVLIVRRAKEYLHGKNYERLSLVFICLQTYSLNKLQIRRSKSLAAAFWYHHQLSKTMSRLMENAVASRARIKAEKRFNLGILKEYLGKWERFSSAKKAIKMGSHGWKLRQYTIGMGALVNNMLQRQREFDLSVLARSSFRRSSLATHLSAWRQCTAEILHDRYSEGVAMLAVHHRGLRKAFEGWYEILTAPLRLALAFERISLCNRVREFLQSWHMFSSRWIQVRNIIKVNQLRRSFLAWIHVSRECKQMEHSLNLAAMYRRGKLLSTCFFAWTEAYVASRSARQVLDMAKFRGMRCATKRYFTLWVNHVSHRSNACSIQTENASNKGVWSAPEFLYQQLY